MSERILSQKTRFLLLFIEVGVLCLASYLAFGEPFPPNNDKGFWFYAALLGLILGSRLDTPFFVKPADVVLYAAPAAIALALVNYWSEWSEGERIAYVMALTYVVVAALLGAIAILTLNAKSISSARLSMVTKTLAEVLGTPKSIFTVVIIFALYVFHRDSATELGLIAGAWALTAILLPLETAINLGGKIRRIFLGQPFVQACATVVAYQTPGLVLVRKGKIGGVDIGDIVAVNDPAGRYKVCLAMDYVGRDDGILLRLVEIDSRPISGKLAESLASLQPNEVVVLSPDDVSQLRHDLLNNKDALVGIVAPDTSLERLFFEVSNEEELEEGKLVEVQISGRTVTYQVVNGLTREEIVHQKNTHGFSRGQAQKIGEWNVAAAKFVGSKWLPRPNSPVFLKRAETFEPAAEAVGHFPGTNYPASVRNIHELVTHNTAILGILGVGKSMLAIELVERLIAVGIKVICLDLTSQYATELNEYYDDEYESECLKRIQDAGNEDRTAFADNPEEGGSLPNLRAAFRADLQDFIRDDNPRMLKIYNPSQVVGSKQSSEPKSYMERGSWKRGAALWSVTPVEVTRIVSETALSLVQDQMSTEARVCLVYEEAHSLVPEFNSVATPTDREATNGTARAILQGRKYGLGCLLITQRTANVTKTILNQCNTVFAMRTFDETGKEFLSNYIGRDYANSLSSISERHAVFFGRASSCENPVLIRLNDRESFTQVFHDYAKRLNKTAVKAS